MKNDMDYILDRVEFYGHHWIWTGSLNDKGYAVGKGSMSRLSYETFVGPIPSGNDAAHVNCPFRHCISPACLSSMPHAENIRMMACPGSGHGKETHCPKGHPYSDENTYKSKGARRCRECHRQESAERYRNRFKWQT